MLDLCKQGELVCINFGFQDQGRPLKNGALARRAERKNID